MLMAEQAASDARPGDDTEGGRLAGQIKAAVREQTGSQQKDLADAAIQAAQDQLDRKCALLHLCFGNGCCDYFVLHSPVMSICLWCCFGG